MKLSALATRLGTIFGAGATSADLTQPIPATANPSTGRAGFDVGFPAVNFTPLAAGGIPPWGADLNGIFYMLTAAAQELQAGVLPPFDATFASSIGGYPQNAVVADGTTVGTFWVSTADNNTTVPGASGATWRSLFFGLAPIDSPAFTTQLSATYGSGGALSYKLQTDGNAVWYTGTTVLYAIGANGAYTNQPFTAYANINAKYDIVGNGSIGAGGGVSQGGPSNNNFQWTGDLTSGFNPAYSKTNGAYLANALNVYAVSGACAYLGTGVNGGPIVLFTGNGQQGIIGSISTNSGQTGVLFNTTSDRRLKTDIAPVAAADAIARVQKLNPSSFVMTADPNQVVVTGFIADEFAEVYPQGTTGKADATTTNDRGETLIVPQQIDKTFTLPDAIAVIQYLLAEVDALKAAAAPATKAS